MNNQYICIYIIYNNLMFSNFKLYIHFINCYSEYLLFKYIVVQTYACLIDIKQFEHINTLYN